MLANAPKKKLDYGDTGRKTLEIVSLAASTVFWKVRNLPFKNKTTCCGVLNQVNSTVLIFIDKLIK